MNSKPILFKGEMVRAILDGRKTRKKLYFKDSLSLKSLAARLANALDDAPQDGCWVWRRTVSKDGYPRITIGNRGKWAHRIAYEIGVGSIPSGKWVLHKCDNPSCINPSHLELGDQSKNMADCANRMRTASGGKNGGSKLTVIQVSQIRNSAQLGTPQKAIAHQFGVTQSTISRILIGKAWK